MPYSRISVTLPRDLVKAADRKAGALDRSRSWLVAEALRQYLETPATPAGTHRVPRGVREPQPPPYGTGTLGLGEYRLEQLKADLALTPEQRVLAAQQTAEVGRRAGGASGSQRILQFDRYEDYLDWKRREDVR